MSKEIIILDVEEIQSRIDKLNERKRNIIRARKEIYEKNKHRKDVYDYMGGISTAYTQLVIETRVLEGLLKGNVINIEDMEPSWDVMESVIKEVNEEKMQGFVYGVNWLKEKFVKKG